MHHGCLDPQDHRYESTTTRQINHIIIVRLHDSYRSFIFKINDTLHGVSLTGITYRIIMTYKVSRSWDSIKSPLLFTSF